VLLFDHGVVLYCSSGWCCVAFFCFSGWCCAPFEHNVVPRAAIFLPACFLGFCLIFEQKLFIFLIEK
jgi:hypothetical protein